jgi:hypothetical protein
MLLALCVSLSIVEDCRSADVSRDANTIPPSAYKYINYTAEESEVGRHNHCETVGNSRSLHDAEIELDVRFNSHVDELQNAESATEPVTLIRTSLKQRKKPNHAKRKNNEQSLGSENNTSTLAFVENRNCGLDAGDLRRRCCNRQRSVEGLVAGGSWKALCNVGLRTSRRAAINNASPSAVNLPQRFSSWWSAFARSRRSTMFRPAGEARRSRRLAGSTPNDVKTESHSRFHRDRRGSDNVKREAVLIRRQRDLRIARNRDFKDHDRHSRRRRKLDGRTKPQHRSDYDNNLVRRRHGHKAVKEVGGDKESRQKTAKILTTNLEEARHLMRRSDVRIHSAVAKSIQGRGDYARLQQLAERRANIGTAGGVAVSFPAAAKTVVASWASHVKLQQSQVCSNYPLHINKCKLFFFQFS